MKAKEFTRRDFITKTALSGMTITIIPSEVLGGSGRVAPSDKINVALIGSGSQAMKMLPGWLKRPELHFVSVCDPNKESYDYPDWGRSTGSTYGLPGGRDVGRHRINKYYADQLGKETYKGCTAYADFREMLEMEKDVNAVFIMTPDHLHAVYAIMAMKKGIMVAAHKPVGNFMQETRVAIDTAKSTGVPTHMFAFQDPQGAYIVKDWIKQGVIGKVTELHRWTNRPMWPQGSPYLPSNTPPIPAGFDWDIWLGPSLPRPYSPDYTHTVFRGWYEFGAGCLADMGYYAFLVDWRVLNLGMPLVAEASASFTCEVRDFKSTWVKNNLSFPHAASLRMEVPVKGTNENIDVFWHEGGIKPIAPKELRAAGKTLPDDGIMIVGEKGKILNAYNNPVFLGVKNGDALVEESKKTEAKRADINAEMIEYFRGGKESRGSYPNGQNVAEAICLGNLAIRMDQRLEWDPANLKVINVPEANEFVKRKFREGWEV